MSVDCMEWDVDLPLPPPPFSLTTSSFPFSPSVFLLSCVLFWCPPLSFTVSFHSFLHFLPPLSSPFPLSPSSSFSLLMRGGVVIACSGCGFCSGDRRSILTLFGYNRINAAGMTGNTITPVRPSVCLTVPRFHCIFAELIDR